MPDTITPAQTDALAKLAEIPPGGSEERERWLEAAGRLMAEKDAATDWLLSDAAILTLMSEVRLQGQRDALAITQSSRKNEETGRE